MRIGVIGSGSMGRILASKLAKVGHDVSIANSKGPESLSALASEIGAGAASVVDTVRADVVVLAVPTRAVVELPPRLFADVRADVVVIDLGNYHPELRDGRIDAIERGMLDSEWVAERIGRPVIKAFNSILAASLLDKGAPRGAQGRIALPVAGDLPHEKAVVQGLVDDLGFDPVDAGTLDDSWRQQTGAPAYCKDLDVDALVRALARADRRLIAQYRAQREADLRQMMQARSAASTTPA